MRPLKILSKYLGINFALLIISFEIRPIIIVMVMATLVVV